MYESVAGVTNESQLMDLLGEFVGEKVNHITYRQQTVICLSGSKVIYNSAIKKFFSLSAGRITLFGQFGILVKEF